MCTISIDPNSISAVPTSPGQNVISVSGTVADCNSNSIKVTIACHGQQPVPASVTITGNTWTAKRDISCACGTPITITATCQDEAPCTATYTTTLNCRCCPQVSTIVTPGLWNSSGQQSVTFETTLTFPPGCIVTVQRDFGDGTFGAIHPFASSPVTYWESHDYAGGGYTSNLNVLSNTSCPPSPASVNVPQGGDPSGPGGAPKCATKPLFAAICRALRLLFLLFAGAAGVLLIASAPPSGCLAFNAALPAIAAGFATTAATILALLYLICRKCECGFPWKLLAQLLIIIGAVLFIFVPPPVCMQPAPFPAPFVALWLAFLVTLAGVIILYALWYLPFRAVCPLTKCDFWRAVRDALIIASLVVALFVYPALAAGVTLTGLGFALLVITLLLIMTNHEIQDNQNSGNC